MSTDLPNGIETQPKRFSGDTGSAEQHSLPDVIEFDKYKNSKDAVSKSDHPFGGTRIGKVSHPPTY